MHNPTAEKRSILFLIADDLGKYLGCYGVKSIRTPNIDRLAARGTMFDMAFTSTASCSASRSVMYTGLHTHENGQYGLADTKHHFTTFNHVETLPDVFKSLGYVTGIIGKVHVGPASVYPWEIREESGTRDVAWVADRADAFFSKAKEINRPFHLTVGFIDPHRDLTRSGFGNENFNDDRIGTTEVSSEDVEIPPFLNDLPEVRTELVEYYQSIQRMDRGVGLILKALEKQELEDSTMICFVSDNGPPFVNSKTTLYDAEIRLPVIVSTPWSKGEVNNPNMISYIDILPTFLDWAGAKSHTPSVKAKDNSPSRLGTSFLPILECSELLPEDKWQHHSKLGGIRNTPPPVMLGQRPLKNYIWRPAEELYDLENDPEEVHNLAQQPEYTELVREHREKLEAWQLKTKDIWLYRDGVSVVMNQHHQEAGLRIPDKFEIDVEDPGNRNIACWPERMANL
ncbi:alkaline-phosphatase-like protein [Xylogone sp. PMI_703]|nr:alkaline-phosphatase-like protein [Xylogone sp. PMI_703]